MRRPRFEARNAFHLLAVALILIAAAAAALRSSSPGRGRGQGQDRPRLARRLRVPLARPPGARRHGHARTTSSPRCTTPSSRIRAPSSTTISPWPSASRSPRTPRAPPSRCARGSSSTTASRSPRRTSSGATRTTAGAKADVFKKKTERVEIVDDRTIRFVFKEPFLDFAILFGTANVAGAGWVVPEKYYKQVGAGRLQAEADRRRPLQARPPRAGREDRDGGLRRLLPPGQRQAARHGLGAGGGDPRRHAGARRGGHHLQRARRADRPRSGSFPGSRWRRCCPARSSSSSPASRTPRTRSTTSACARR